MRELVQHTAPYPERMEDLRKAQTDPLDNNERDSIDNLDETIPEQPINNDDLQFRANDKRHLQQKDTANFKYLSQLIHRIHVNDTKRPSGVIAKPGFQQQNMFMGYQKKNQLMNSRPKISDLTRRFNNQIYPPDPKVTENSFYTNLGKQIASLIRGVDASYGKQIDIEIEHLDKNVPNQPIFSELSYPPHSYWERFARSPINDLQQYKDNMEYFNKSNEILYNIENKVELAASTKSPMSLLEIENVVNVIEGPLRDNHKDLDATKIQSSHNTLNINLWPQVPLSNTLFNAGKPIVTQLQQFFNCTNKFIPENHFTSESKTISVKNKINTGRGAVNNINNDSSSRVQNYKKVMKSNEVPKEIVFTKYENPIYKIKLPENSNNIILPKRQSIRIPKRHTNIPLSSMSPMFDYNPKQFLNINGQYPFYNNLLKIKFPTVEKSVNIPLLRTAAPSYFHHELHHFDYID